jgi:hypothetical protein
MIVRVKRLLLFLFALTTTATYAQKKYWQQQVNFTINVSLNDHDNSLQAFETIEYINNSPDTLSYLWFHIWPNAYKNDRTAFSEQFLRNGRSDFYFSPQEDKGYINQLDFKTDGINTSFETDKNIDIIKLLLPHPLPPGQKTVITTPFHVKIPKYFSRGGHIGHDYYITQWFPKPAVYDSDGWHAMPYLDQGEFYSEFGKYDVSITAPSAYVVPATGILQDEKTLQELKTKGKPSIDGSLKTWHYTQQNIHDFAWFASKDFIVKYDTAVLDTKTVDLFSYYKPKDTIWQRSVSYLKDGIKRYSRWVGDYPYSVASIVHGSFNESSGGMEYPTISLISPQQNAQELDATIVHEAGHNWFYGALANNEREHAWMDEGINTYYQKKYEDQKYKTYSYLKSMHLSLNGKLPDDEEELLLSTYAKLKKDQPIETTSEKFTVQNYTLMVYFKASRWLKKLENELGTSLFDSCMRAYYNEWKFKHVQPADFKASFEKTSGHNLDQIFSELHKIGPINSSTKKTPKLTFLYNLNKTDKYNYISFAPAIGYNHYDKFMFGGLVHNYQMPLNNFHFVAGALVSKTSKQTHPFGRVSYTLYNGSYNLEGAVSYINYTQNNFTNLDSHLYLQLKRLVPSVKLTLFDKEATSTRRLTLQLKSFFLNEDNLKFFTVFTPTDTISNVKTEAVKSTINRLSVTLSDDRLLYPYNLNFTADQGKNFIRTGLTAKYLFNYPDGKSGLSARFFAGKFFYLVPKTLSTQLDNDKYFLNMTGPKGSEDYTYSDYFVGRNEFQHWKSQQIMERDGFFKVNTDLLGEKVGKTDDWLMSLNLVSSLPDKVNPLSVLPFRIPLKLFADVGTYSGAWKDNPATGRFLYDAGLQVSLIKSLVNIYIPVLYSKVYSNYYKSTITEHRFLRTIAFNIDLSQLQVRKMLPDLPL